MNRSHLWKFVSILIVLLLAISELVPPTDRDLVEQFNENAIVGRDATLDAIVKRGRELQQSRPKQPYENLVEAIGTNNFVRYFPTNYVNFAVVRDPAKSVLSRLQRDAAGQIRLGLDLKGGIQFVMRMDTSRVETNRVVTSLEKQYLLEQAVEVVRKRVDRFGVAEPAIQPQGDDRILIQLPGMSASQMEDAERQLKQAAFLSFHLVDPENTTHLQEGIVPPGYERRQMKQRDRRTDREYYEPIIIKRGAERGMTGKYVSRAGVSHDSMTGSPEITFQLTSEGAKIFGEITSANVGKSLAILLDGEVVSAPRINGAITGGSGVITGSFSDKEAIELATNLENPLAAPLSVESAGVVDPTMGAGAVASGFRSAIIGVIAIAAFMVVYYMVAGAVANVAMILNLIILLGVLCSIDVTLTLPGIAGIVLTIGMAVDANVLIYERMREELAAGKSVRGAVAAGYSKAFGTIFDSNLTTLISSVLLIIFGTGTIKGFGTALTVGLIVSMFTALVVTRLIFDFLLARGWMTSLPMLQLIRGSKIDFLGLAKPAFAISWALIVIGCAYGFYRGKNMLGVDFAGGDDIQLTYKQIVPVEKVSAAIAELKLGDAVVQYQSTLGGGESAQSTLRVTAPLNSGTNVIPHLQKTFPDAGFASVGLERVGASIGAEIQKSAIIATLLSLFFILVYVAFRYEFSFAVGAVLAIVHDILMTTGWYCLTGVMGEGRQFNSTFIAALLTIIGFSINDTIVIFDRIREDLKLNVRGSFKDLMNFALNQTLSRTIITSGTVLMATLSLYLFGGPAINDFAFTFLVGILTGTYSSIYIASSIVLWWHKGERPKIGNTVQAVSQEDIERATINV
jgi:SecD/SecF fusion protein